MPTEIGTSDIWLAEYSLQYGQNQHIHMDDEKGTLCSRADVNQHVRPIMPRALCSEHAENRILGKYWAEFSHVLDRELVVVLHAHFLLVYNDYT